MAVAGCTGRLETALGKLLEARSLSADLLVQFTRSADAGNRAVMAGTDEASSAFAREAEDAMQAVQKDVDTLGPILGELGYSAERALLEEFGKPFAEYRTLNQSILGLAVENTNLKAQRLSFGSGQEAADAFRDALEPVRQSATESDRWHVEALVARAIGAVREIQVVQAPHIAEADDAAMTGMEKRMATAEGTAREALKTLATVPPGSRPRLAAAVARWTASWPSTRTSSCCRAETATSARWRSHSARSGCSPRSARTRFAHCRRRWRNAMFGGSR